MSSPGVARIGAAVLLALLLAPGLARGSGLTQLELVVPAAEDVWRGRVRALVDAARGEHAPHGWSLFRVEPEGFLWVLSPPRSGPASVTGGAVPPGWLAEGAGPAVRRALARLQESVQKVRHHWLGEPVEGWSVGGTETEPASRAALTVYRVGQSRALRFDVTLGRLMTRLRAWRCPLRVEVWRGAGSDRPLRLLLVEATGAEGDPLDRWLAGLADGEEARLLRATLRSLAADVTDLELSPEPALSFPSPAVPPSDG